MVAHPRHLDVRRDLLVMPLQEISPNVEMTRGEDSTANTARQNL